VNHHMTTIPQIFIILGVSLYYDIPTQ
jgi:hypothetical protein